MSLATWSAFAIFHSLGRVRVRLIEIGRDAKKTIAIATAYPIRSDAIVISKGPFQPPGTMPLD
jgi:hypothetical protein